MMGSDFRIGDQFQSTAKLIEIPRFYFGEFEFPDLQGVDPIENCQFKPAKGWWPKVPVLIQSDGLPWEIGSAYLLTVLKSKQPWDMETLRSRANYLLAYLRFLEDTGTHFMHFPFNKSERVTYLFRDMLQSFIVKGLNPQYASNIINAVVHFYRTIAEENFISEEDFKNLPFKTINRFIKFLDAKGFGRFKTVTTSDIAIKHSKPHKRLDRISDGGELRPLRVEEQRSILSAFDRQLCPYHLELMMRIALSTGARIQTVCTIRVHHIRSAYRKIISDNLSCIEIQAGNGAENEGYLINTKRGKLHRLLFPRKLIEDLYIYATADYHQSLMGRSYYGKGDLNYLFLTETASPFYISKQEIQDRQNTDSYYSVNSADFVQNKGDTVRMNLNTFRKKLKSEFPDVGYFKFHDLRATFGMNLVRRLESKGYKSGRILSEVKSRMGHSSIATTQEYLDFEQLGGMFEEVSVEFESELLSDYVLVGSDVQ
jgi:integrase